LPQEAIMFPNEPLSPELEAQAQELAARIRNDDEILALARLWSARPSTTSLARPSFKFAIWSIAWAPMPLRNV
jgi:hypothetical protein